MSRRLVRAAIAEYFGGTLVAGKAGTYRGSSIPALGTLYLASPKRFPASDFFANQGGAKGVSAGAMCVVRINRQRENRRSSGRGSGIKRLAYDAQIDCYHLSNASDSVKSQNELDDFIDAMEALLRTDPTLGGKVFSAGEGDISTIAGEAGYIEWEIGAPVNAGERTETYAVLRFVVVEHVQG